MLITPLSLVSTQPDSLTVDHWQVWDGTHQSCVSAISIGTESIHDGFLRWCFGFYVNSVHNLVPLFLLGNQVREDLLGQKHVFWDEHNNVNEMVSALPLR